MPIYPEVVEVCHLVCELRVPLPVNTWGLLISVMMNYGNLALTVELLVCAMQVSIKTVALSLVPYPSGLSPRET